MTPQDPPTTPFEEPAPPPRRRLLRSASDRMIAGVAGGLARHFGVDATIVRIVFAIATLLSGAGVAVYAILAMVLPADDGPAYVDGSSGFGRKLLLGTLIAIAIFALPFGGHFLFDGPGLLFFAFVAAIGVLVWRAAGGRQDRTVTRVAIMVVSVAGALALGLGAAVAAAFGAGAVVAGLIIAVGLALIVGGLLGGARWLVVPALLMAIPVTVVSAADINLEGGVGQRDLRPASLDDLRSEYRLGMGELRIDARDVEFDGRTELDLSVGMGHIELTVPEDVCVQTRAHVGAGKVQAFDRVSDGIDVDVDHRPQPAVNASTLVVDAEAGMGLIEINHRPTHGYGFDFGEAQTACRTG